MITNLFVNMLFLYYFDAQWLLLYIIVTLTYILLFNMMNHKLKQVTVRASRVSKSLFQGSSSSSSRREAMLRCARGEEEEQHGEEKQGGEVEWCGKEQGGEEEEAELERVSRQTQRSHVVAPPIAPAREEDRVLIRPLGDM
jgi:hypothetical protein